MKLRNKKTGDIWQFDYISMPISDITKEKLGARGCSGSCCARSLSELNEDWEDVEPLIKDKNIRKMIREWAELNNIKDVGYIITGGGISVLTKNGIEIDFTFQVQGVQDGKHYTIAELCGEEEDV